MRQVACTSDGRECTLSCCTELENLKGLGLPLSRGEVVRVAHDALSVAAGQQVQFRCVPPVGIGWCMITYGCISILQCVALHLHMTARHVNPRIVASRALRLASPSHGLCTAWHRILFCTAACSGCTATASCIAGAVPGSRAWPWLGWWQVAK